MNILGIGIDTVDIGRFRKAVEQRGEVFLNKIFTENELSYVSKKRFSYMHMAGKFAAKEAVKKALPEGAGIGLNWPEIEVLNSEDGKPYTVLHGHAEKIMQKFGITRVFVSISHTDDIATSNAMVVK